MDPETGLPVHYSTGTADIIILDYGAKIATLIDLKFGRIEVPPVAENLQVSTYAAALLQREEGNIDQVRVVILQPRVSRKPVIEFLTLPDVQTIVEAVKSIVATAEAPGLILNPSDEACKYCPAKAICPAITYELEVAASESAVVESFATLPLPVVGELLDRAKLAKRYADSIEKQAKALALELEEAGGTIPGYHLETKPGDRAIKDVNAAYVTLQDALSPDEFIGACKISIPKLEKKYADIIADKTGVTKKAAAEAFALLMGELITRGAERRSLAKDKD